MQHCPACSAQIDRATMRFCSNCGASIDGLLTPTVRGRHRILTIMFVDLVASMALAHALDLEEYDEVLSGFHRVVLEVVGTYGGTMLQHYGDGAMACFGLRKDGEDAALAGLACGLSLARQFHQRLDGQQVRIGVHSGQIMCHVGSAGLQEPQLTGFHVSLAARLQQRAKPGGVVISGQTHAFLSRLARIEMSAKTSVSLPGIVEPFDMIEVSDYAFIPNAAQRSLLERSGCLEQIKAASFDEGGEQGFVVVGPIGIGKTSLLDQLAEDETGLLRLTARSNLTRTPLYPVAECLARRVFPDGAPTVEALDLALAQVGLVPVERERAVLGALLGLQVEPPAGHSPEMLRQLRISISAQLLAAMLRRTGLGLGFDDLQWADEDSLAVLNHLIIDDRCRPSRVVVTGRPELLVFDFAKRVGLTLIHLQPLSDNAARQVLTEGTELAPATRERIVAKAEGNPLFIWALAHQVELSSNASVTTHALPESIEAAFQAIIESFEGEREIISAASVLGRAFRREHLACLLPEDARTLDRLNYLTISGLLDIVPEGYSFSHILIRDAAYNMIPPKQRRVLHGRLFRELHVRDPTFVAAFPSLLADHALAAADVKAIPEACIAAGAYLLRSASFQDAIKYFGHALRHMERHDPAAPRHPSYLSTLALLASAQVQCHGFAHPMVLESYQHLESEIETGQQRGLERMVVLYGIFAHRMIRGRVRACRQVVNTMAGIAAHESLDHQLLWLVNEAAYGLYSGRHRRAAVACDRLEQSYQPARHGRLFLEIGADPLASTLSGRVHLQARAGDLSAARKTMQGAKHHLETIGAVAQLPWIHVFGSVALHFAGDRSQAWAEVDAGVALADAQAAAFWSLVGRIWQAVYLIRDGDAEGGRRRLEPLLQQAEAVGVRINLPIFLAVLAQAHHATGDALRAREVSARATRLIQETGECMFAHQVLSIGEIITGSARSCRYPVS